MLTNLIRGPRAVEAMDTNGGFFFGILSILPGESPSPFSIGLKVSVSRLWQGFCLCNC